MYTVVIVSAIITIFVMVTVIVTTKMVTMGTGGHKDNARRSCLKDLAVTVVEIVTLAMVETVIAVLEVVAVVTVPTEVSN